MSKNLERFLDSLDDSFESNFEDGNFDLDDRSKVAIKSLPPVEQKKIATAFKMAAQPLRGDGITPQIGASSQALVGGLVAQSVGDLNISVKRVGVNIDAALPFIIFGANDRTADYASTLPNLIGSLPAGTTVAVSKNASGGIVFTYSDGVNSDTVTVSNLGNINYQSFLASMQNNFFKTRYFLISISDENYNTQQFAQPLLYGKLSALGMVGSNQLILRSRTNSWMFRRDRIEVVMPEQSVVPDFSLAMSMIKVNNLELGFDFFMSSRFNNNNI